MPELWVPKFSIEVSGRLPWVAGLDIPKSDGSVYIAESTEYLRLSCVSERAVKGQLPLKDITGVRITTPFVFGKL